MKKERTFIISAKRFLKPAFKEYWISFRAFIIYGLWSIGPVIHILFIKNIVEAIENSNKNEFIDLIIYYAIYNFIFEIVLFLVRKWGWIETINGYRKIIHKEYINKFFTLSSNSTEKLGTGKLIALLDRGMDRWSLILDDLIHNFINIFITLIFTIYMIFSENIIYGFIFITIYIALHILGGYINNYTLKYRRKRENTWHIYTKNLVKIIMNKFEILQTSKGNKEVINLDNISDKLKFRNLKMSLYNHMFFRFPEGFISWVKFFILFYLGLQIIDGNSSMATFVGIFGILTLMDTAINRSMMFYKTFTKEFASIEKMWNFFDDTPEIKGYIKGNEFRYNKGKIEIKNLTYGYIDNKPVFKNFDLQIKGEKVTALVGSSGSGKTTLVKLISGYIKSDKGEIIIDEQKLSETSLKSYYKDIGYLTQEPSVFDGSVLDNLTYAIDRELKKGELEKILKQSKCEFIYDLPDGINTEIGEKGIRLSGGQRQRLAIAKIFLKNPKIILLDEPTSALDSFSEELITKAMHNLFKGRTIIIIAHRLQTVKNADDIILLSDGKIKERGTHDELVLKKGIYKKMLDLQSGF